MCLQTEYSLDHHYLNSSHTYMLKIDVHEIFVISMTNENRNMTYTKTV